ncbi:NAD-dependent epimerase/dehydratase family protein [Capnocytophaga canis]|uniref:NAD-dependent epimerase/dehydratase family protein n=1 Tax=Capnocytophaga canis TaxID=1848903 RepID=UPI0037CEEA4B
MKTILLTGATGFLGSHICQRLIDLGYIIYATYRSSSSFERCQSFISNVSWINVDKEEVNNFLSDVNLDILIHVAWAGVSVEGRNNWDLQLKNFEFSRRVFDIAVQLGVKKIIGIGSQAEYGLFSQKVSEDYLPEPHDAYGATKLFTMHYLINLAKKENLNWYWIRVFSVVGEKENSGWLLSLVRNKLAQNETIDLTEGEQSYDYLYCILMIFWIDSKNS